MNEFSYVFMWQGKLHLGLPMPNEKSKLNVHTPEALDVEIGEPIIEEGLAVVPVVLHNKGKKDIHQQITFEFVG